MDHFVLYREVVLSKDKNALPMYGMACQKVSFIQRFLVLNLKMKLILHLASLPNGCGVL